MKKKRKENFFSDTYIEKRYKNILIRKVEADIVSQMVDKFKAFGILLGKRDYFENHFGHFCKSFLIQFRRSTKFLDGFSTQFLQNFDRSWNLDVF